MHEATSPSSPVARLSDQLRVPAGWSVELPARLAGGVLGLVRADLAVLAPGPGGASIHRAQLVAFVNPAGGGDGDPAAMLVAAAAADVPEAWHVDAERGWTVVYRAPWQGRFRSRTLVYPGEAVVPLALTRTEVVPLPRLRAR